MAAQQDQGGHPDVTVVITAHDAGEALLETVRALDDAGPFACIHVVDSGSGDGSIEALEAARQDVAVTRLGENLGPCVTRNRGVEAAETELVLLLDDDMRLAPGLVQLLKDALAADPSRAMAGPRILREDDPEKILYEGVAHHFSGLAHMSGYGMPDEPRPVREVDGLTSAVLLVRREAVLAVGGFEPAFFFLMEDVEFSFRLLLAGHRLVVVPEARAWNAGGSSGLSLTREAYPERRVYLHARNRMLLVLGNYEKRSLFLLFWPLLLVDLAWFGFACLSGNGGRFLAGRGAIVREWKAIRAARSRMRALRRRPDGDLLGCPPLTLTDQAARGRGRRALFAMLDGSLRLLWRPIAGLLP